jgi:hypothetical protein
MRTQSRWKARGIGHDGKEKKEKNQETFCKVFEGSIFSEEPAGLNSRLVVRKKHRTWNFFEK